MQLVFLAACVTNGGFNGSNICNLQPRKMIRTLKTRPGIPCGYFAFNLRYPRFFDLPRLRVRVRFSWQRSSTQLGKLWALPFSSERFNSPSGFSICFNPLRAGLLSPLHNQLFTSSNQPVPFSKASPWLERTTACCRSLFFSFDTCKVDRNL